METELQRQNNAHKAALARITAAALKSKTETPKEIPKPENVIHLVPPTDNAAADAMDMIIAAVGTAMEVPVNEIIAGPPLPEIISARKLAMALCVRRPRFGVARVAEHFEVCEEAVSESLRILDPILCQYAISGKSPLHLCLPLIVKIWSGKLEEARRVPTVREVQSAVCQVWRITHNDMISACRTKGLVEPRQVAMALCRYLTPRSLPEIGRRFGGRDHTTCYHGFRKMKPVIDAVSERMSPLSTPYEWAVAVHEQLPITPPLKIER